MTEPVCHWPPTPLGRNELIAIGNVVVEWAYLESKIDESIWLLLNRPETSEFEEQLAIPFKQRMDLWKDLTTAISLEEEAVKQLHGIIDQATDMHGSRNLIVHGQWGTNSDEKVPSGVIRWKFTPDWKTTFHPISLKRMEGLAKKSRNLTEEIYKFEDHHILGKAVPRIG